jgi:hypothetical protein
MPENIGGGREQKYCLINQSVIDLRNILELSVKTSAPRRGPAEQS